MRRTLSAAATVLLASTLIVPVGAQDSIDDARARRQAIQQDAAETAAQIDELNAEDAEIVAALEQIDAWVAIQESNLERARQQLQVARDVEADANARAAELADQIVELEQLVRDQLVESYIGDFRNDDELILGADDINDIPLLRFLLDEATGDAVAATDLFRLATSQQADAIAEAEAATAEAELIEADIETRIAELDASRAAQERVRAEVTARIDALEAVAATLEAEDQQIADFIRAEQERIRLEEERLRLEAEAEQRRIEEEEARRLEAERLAEEQAERERQEQQAAPEDQDQPDGGGDSADEPAPTPEPEPEPQPEPDPGAPNFQAPVPHGISSGFGYRIHPIYGTSRLHTGLDYNSPNGYAIASAAPGTVIFVGAYSGYGNTVIVQHSGGYTTLYAHMSAFNVSNGASVSAGTTVGFVGTTGLSTGPHLHFEIRINGTAVDPIPLL